MKKFRLSKFLLLLLMTITTVIVLMFVLLALKNKSFGLDFNDLLNESRLYFQIWRIVLYTAILTLWFKKLKPTLVSRQYIDIQRFQRLIIGFICFLELSAHFQTIIRLIGG